MKTILCLHSSADLYGSDRSLLRLVTGGLPFRFVVVLPYEGPLTGALREAGVECHVLPLAVIRRSLLNPVGMLKLAWNTLVSIVKLFSLIRRERVDLVLANTTAVLGGEVASWFCGVPYIQYVREIIVSPEMVGRFFSWRALLASKIICVSQGTRKPFVARCPRLEDKTIVLYNGIDLEKFTGGDRGKLRRELEIGTDTVLVGALGRISKFKGMDFFVDGAEKFLSQHPGVDVRFVIIGSAFRKPGDSEEGLVPAEEELLARIKNADPSSRRPHPGPQEGSAGLCRSSSREATGESHFSWLPFREDVSDVLAGLDIFVLPSMLPDPLPTIVLEAMAAARPVIGTNHGGVPEMITGEGRVDSGNMKPESCQDGSRDQGGFRVRASDQSLFPAGLLVEPGDISGLAETIARLVNDSGLRERMGAAGRDRCREYFSLQDYLPKIQKALEELL